MALQFKFQTIPYPQPLKVKCSFWLKGCKKTKNKNKTKQLGVGWDHILLITLSNAMTNLDSILKKQRHYFANKGSSNQSYGFYSSHVQMWELGYKESWALKNWCFWTVVSGKTLERPLDCKEIQPVHPRDQSWVFTGRNDVEAETLILWPPDAKSWLIGKDSDAGRDWGQEEKGMTEDELVA